MKSKKGFPQIGRDFEKWSDLDCLLPIIDLDSDYAMGIADLVLIAGLLKSDQRNRGELISKIYANLFNPKGFEHFLFQNIIILWKNNINITEEVLERIAVDFSPSVFGVKGTQRDIYSCSYTLRQILSLNPNNEQIENALHTLQEWEKTRQRWE